MLYNFVFEEKRCFWVCGVIEIIGATIFQPPTPLGNRWIQFVFPEARRGKVITKNKPKPTTGAVRLMGRLLRHLSGENAKALRQHDRCQALLTEDAILDWVRNRLLNGHKLDTRARQCRPIRVGTDFSGLETPSLALSAIEPPVNFNLEFICERDPALRAFAVAAHRPSIVYDDILSRDMGAMPNVDLYIAGPPCQAFSVAGKRSGLADEAGRGHMWAQSLEYVKEKKPLVAILENVPNLVTSFSTEFRHVVDNLKSSGYKAKYKILCTSDHGIPHDRRRVYVVAIKNDALQSKFHFPKKLDWTIKLGDLLQHGKQVIVGTKKVLSVREQAIISNATRMAAKKDLELGWLALARRWVTGWWAERSVLCAGMAGWLTAWLAGQLAGFAGWLGGRPAPGPH